MGLETILGFQLHGSHLKIEPCIPPKWPGYEITYRHGSAIYHVVVDNAMGTGRGVSSVTLDGQPVSDGRHRPGERRATPRSPRSHVRVMSRLVTGRAGIGRTMGDRLLTDDNVNRLDDEEALAHPLTDQDLDRLQANDTPVLSPRSQSGQRPHSR